MATNLISPGVKVTREDLSQTVEQAGTSLAVFAGNFSKGPVGSYNIISSVTELKDLYGLPNFKNYNEWYQAWNFLQYAGNLAISRAADLNGTLKKIDLVSVQAVTNDITENLDPSEVKVYKVTGKDVFFDRTSIFNIGDTFVINNNKYTVEYITNETLEVEIKQEVNVDESGADAGSSEDTDGGIIINLDDETPTIEDIPVETARTETVNVTRVTFNEYVYADDTLTKVYRLTTEVSDAKNILVLNGYNEDITEGDIFNTSGEISDPLFKIEKVEIKVEDEEYKTYITFSGYKNQEEPLYATLDDRFYKLNRTTSSCVEIPGGTENKVYEVVKYNSVDHTISNDATFEDEVESLPFVNNSAKLKFYSRTPGKWGNSIDIAIAKSDDFGKGNYVLDGVPLDNLFEYEPVGTDFAVIVIYENEIVEKFTVNFDENAVDNDGTTKFIGNVINQKSSYVFVKINSANPNKEVVSKLFSTNGIANLVYGTDSTAGRDDIQAAYDVFSNKEEIEVDIVISNEIAPHAGSNLAIQRADCLNYIGASREDTVGLKASVAVQKVVSFRKNLNIDNMQVTMTDNYKRQYSNELQKYIWVNLAGDIAGLRAQTNFNNGIGYAAAGYKRGKILNVDKLAYTPSQAQKDLLYKNGINSVVNIPNEGVVLMGQKTLQNMASSFNRVNVVSLFNGLERSLGKMSKYALFEFNDTYTQNYITSLIKPALAQYKASREIQDYLVICNETNNTDYVVSNNQFIIDVLIKPTYAIDFIHLRFKNVGVNDFSIAIS